LYEQVKRKIEEQIKQGTWKVGAYLPSETVLGQALSVSPGTVRHALQLLEAKGAIVRSQGRGTRVVDLASGRPSNAFNNLKDRMGRIVPGDIVKISQKVVAANAQERNRLILQEDERIVRERRLRYLNGRCYMYEEAALALTRFPGLQDAPSGDYRVRALAQQHGISATSAIETVSAAQVTRTIARRFGAHSAFIGLMLDRIIFDEDGAPLQWRIAYVKTIDVAYIAETFATTNDSQVGAYLGRIGAAVVTAGRS
jgi:DNA-binding GntR family transcriptional regulator